MVFFAKKKRNILTDDEKSPHKWSQDLTRWNRNQKMTANKFSNTIFVVVVFFSLDDIFLFRLFFRNPFRATRAPTDWTDARDGNENFADLWNSVFVSIFVLGWGFWMHFAHKEKEKKKRSLGNWCIRCVVRRNKTEAQL